MKNYIIGYGSLINFESQNKTGRSFSSTPATLHGFKRSWSVTYDHIEFCALGVFENQNSKINVVIFETENLDAFDLREHGYTRVEIKNHQLAPWKNEYKIPGDGKIWMYLPISEKIGTPSDKHFIWQSYVDVILMGCVSIDLNFAYEFLKSTEGWNFNHIKDDRASSHYLKGLKNHDATVIDRLITEFFNQK